MKYCSNYISLSDLLSRFHKNEKNNLVRINIDKPVSKALRIKGDIVSSVSKHVINIKYLKYLTKIFLIMNEINKNLRLDN